MENSFKGAVQKRRSYYDISDKSPISDSEITDIVNFTVKNVPSAFNSQTTRIVILFGKHHAKLWSIVMETLRKIVPHENFSRTEEKINAFAAGYATILFFEDMSAVNLLKSDYPTYAERFPVWSQHTNAMHQFTIWTMLEDAGFGASLQHYNPIIDNEVHLTWNLSEHWKLIAEMPFGTPLKKPEKKSCQPLENRVLTFK